MIRSVDWVCFKEGVDKETCEKMINLAESKLPKISDKEETYDRHIENYEDQEKTDIAWCNEQWIYDLSWSYMDQANIIFKLLKICKLLDIKKVCFTIGIQMEKEIIFLLIRV